MQLNIFIYSLRTSTYRTIIRHNKMKNLSLETGTRRSYTTPKLYYARGRCFDCDVNN